MNKLIQNDKNTITGKIARGSLGLTMLELMLVVGIMAVFAASSAPYVMRSIGWMNQILELEQDYYRIYEASVLISRFIGSGGKVSEIVLNTTTKELKANSSTMVTNVTSWSYTKLINSVYRCDLTIAGSGGEEQSVRFVVSGFE